MFESSKTDEKRGLLGFVFSNLELEGATLRYTLIKPFEVFAQLPTNPEWRPLRPANHNFRACRGTNLIHNLPYFIGFSENSCAVVCLDISSRQSIIYG